eukprot:5346900-Pyramimonas_sp.AAC.2
MEKLPPKGSPEHAPETATLKSSKAETATQSLATTTNARGSQGRGARVLGGGMPGMFPTTTKI